MTLKEQQALYVKDVHTFIISRTFLLRMRNVSDKSCRQNQNTHCMFNDFSSKNCTVWYNV